MVGAVPVSHPERHGIRNEIEVDEPGTKRGALHLIVYDGKYSVCSTGVGMSPFSAAKILRHRIVANRRSYVNLHRWVRRRIAPE